MCLWLSHSGEVFRKVFVAIRGVIKSAWQSDVFTFSDSLCSSVGLRKHHRAESHMFSHSCKSIV